MLTLATAAHVGAAVGGGLVLGLLFCGLMYWFLLLRRYLQTGVPAPAYRACLRESHWTGRDLLFVGVVVGVYILLYFIIGSLLRAFGVEKSWVHVVVALQNTLLQLLVGTVLLIRLFSAGRGLRESFRLAGARGRSWGGVVGQIAKWYVLVLPLILVAALISQGLFAQPDQEHSFQPVLVVFRDAATPGWFRWWLAGVAVILAPVVEEVLFRGVVLPVMLQKNGVWMSLVGCSLLFAVVHGHLPAMLPLFALGMGLGAAYLYTGDLLVPIGMHALFNGVSLLVLLLTSFPNLV